MADAFVILPDDSGNVGKKVRTQTRTVAGNEVHEHMFNLVDPIPAGNNNIGDVDVVSSALPAGAATEATLAALNPLTDAQLRASPVPVSGTITSTPSGTQDVNIVKVSGTAIALGQTTMAASFPVVLASNQSSIPVAATLSAETTKIIGTVNIAAAQTIAVTNVGTFAVQATLSDETTKVIGTVNQGTSPWVVSGTVTANAGTNLNTSLLALESGGNLAAIAASLSIIDDWDESDRAKVNPIVGQIGVQGNSGVVTALTQRVVLATDVALPTGTNSIGKISDITTSITPGTGTSNLGKRENDAYTGTDVGILLIGKDIDNAKLQAVAVGYDATTTSYGLVLVGRDRNNSVWRSINVDENGNIVPASGNSYSENITTTGTGISRTLAGGTQLASGISIAVVGSAVPATSWTIYIEISLDSTNWTAILAHTDNDGDGIMTGLAKTLPFLYWRINCTALSLGSANHLVVSTAVTT